MKNLRWVLILTSAITAGAASAEPVKLPAGMLVELELQHHVTSGYLPAGSPIYFRVANDVAIGDQTLIRKGMLVTGKMQQSQNPGMAGRSGAMMLNVNTITAVDGAVVPVECDLAKQGRSRGAALVGWTLFWGIPGLMTRGVNPYLERGALLDAEVTHTVSVDPQNAQGVAATESSTPEAAKVQFTGYRFKDVRPNAFTFDIERKRNLKTVDFDVQPPAEIGNAADALHTIELISVDGIPVPEPIHAASATAKSVTFDGWSVVQFCRDGATELGFRGVSGDGQAFEATYPMTIKIKKKKQKQQPLHDVKSS